MRLAKYLAHAGVASRRAAEVAVVVEVERLVGGPEGVDRVLDPDAPAVEGHLLAESRNTEAAWGPAVDWRSFVEREQQRPRPEEMAAEPPLEPFACLAAWMVLEVAIPTPSECPLPILLPIVAFNQRTEVPTRPSSEL